MQGTKFWLKIGLFLSIPLILIGVSYITQRGLPQQLISSLTLTIASLSKQTPNVRGTTTTDSKPVVGNEQIITCKIDEKCGGGNKQVKKSECYSSTCCDLPNGSWAYISYNECNNIHNFYNIISPDSLNSSPQANEISVYLESQNLTIGCPTSNVEAVQNIDKKILSKNPDWTKEYDECVSTFKNNDSCHLSCTTELNRNENKCTQNIEEWSTKEYNECREVVSELYRICSDQCPSAYPECDWVYAELKILLSQINTLCE